jgi:hypothetical protein
VVLYDLKSPVTGAVSMGRRNIFLEVYSQGSTAKSRLRALIQTEHHSG